ncbi:hypothetical protein KVR01_013843 [Diaporthe batatas]|uniref:uncharacterized protein n=1 Tax=Diaporthe batatas TaxID=748121 RepID=UPI001D03EF28|nr:uncharacterized protein KVR01_013843 [Diaporthe batatas]KAG8156308.1 hypothetical protein KVR01_013843 [Diaporthe batatas]
MATLETLKKALRESAEGAELSTLKQPLSDAQYSAGFDVLTHGAGWMSYEDFIIPQTIRLLGPLFASHPQVSVLEVGPGPRTLLGYLPLQLRRKVRKYRAYEPNGLFAAQLKESLGHNSESGSPLPNLKSPEICQRSFDSEDAHASHADTSGSRTVDEARDKYDVILFCHSMYGMEDKHMVIRQARKMLRFLWDQRGLILVFHRDNGALHFEDLVAHHTTSFPTGVVSVPDDDKKLDTFANFIAGFSMQSDTEAGNAIRAAWRKVCRTLGRREGAQPGRLMFSSPELMVAFSNHAACLRTLTRTVPLAPNDRIIKNREALLRHPAPVLKPTTIEQIQEVIGYALDYGFGLTVIGGSHSGQCLLPSVVAVDMSGFNQVHIVKEGHSGEGSRAGAVVVAEAGCTTQDIIRKTIAVGMTVPLGSRPSVGAGMWLQGGIGHLARLHGLACDAVVGAVIASVENEDRIFCIGDVPSQHQPVGAVRPENEAELLWAIRGAGTNFGIVLSVTFRAFAAPTYRIRDWTCSLEGRDDAANKIHSFDVDIAKDAPRNKSADLFLYSENGELRLTAAMFASSTESDDPSLDTTLSTLDSGVGSVGNVKTVDGIELFGAETYMSKMHGGHGGGKTSSFKRCIFLEHIGEGVANHLVAAIENRPSPLCYLHLLHGGGAVSEVGVEATAFGCRGWKFACVITGVWSREQDGTDVARSVTQWVYDVAVILLSLSQSRGAYGTDLGPDPRDLLLASKAFGPNAQRLARLKRLMDPRDVLRYACPLPKTRVDQKIIVLVTGESCAGKDFCADVWASVLSRPNVTHHEQITTSVASISDATKRDFAVATGADLRRVLWDRVYKEQHREDLTAFFKRQLRERPNLPQEQFLRVVRGAADVDVLFITGMRDEAPLATFSHLVPEYKIIEVYVEACDQKRRLRKEGKGDGSHTTPVNDNDIQSPPESLSYRPSLTFRNEMAGADEAEEFAKRNLLPFLNEDLQRLANMVRTVSGFPRENVDLRHVLGIPQQLNGLPLCVSLLRDRFLGEWGTVDCIVCCESGGFIFAAALAQEVKRPMLVIRKAGKLPPPTVSVVKGPSFISSATPAHATEERLELEVGKVPQGGSGSIVVVEDVLATGETLHAVLRLLDQAGVGAGRVHVMAIAEFPLHKGRELLHRNGFGRASIQSLLVFGGA